MAKKFLFVDTAGNFEETAGAYEQSDFVDAGGAPNAGKPVKLDGDGNIDASMINEADIDHDTTDGVANSTAHNAFPLLTGARPFTGDLQMGSNKITGMADGSADTDAVTKQQLDAVEAGVQYKGACRVATAAALPAYTASGSQDTKKLTADSNGSINTSGIDGITDLAVGDRVCVKNENGAQGSEGEHIDHGLYEVTVLGDGSNPWEMERTEDADGTPGSEVQQGMFTAILEGTNNAGLSWIINTDNPITVDTTAIEFRTGPTVPTYTASLGVKKVSNDFRADLVASGGIKLVGDSMRIEPADFAGAGLQDDGSDNMAIGDVDKGVQVNADDLEIDASEIAGDGLKQNITNSYVVDVDLKASGGLKIDTAQLAVEPNDFAGAGLVDDGADNLAIDWSTTFDDAKAVKAEDLNSTATGEGASIIGIEDAGAYTDVTDVEAALQELYEKVQNFGNTYTAGTGGVSKGDLLEITGNNTVQPLTITTAGVGIGLAADDASAGNPVVVLGNDTVITGILSSATAGTKYFWNGTGWQTSMPSGSGEYVWLGGVAKNATDAHVEVKYIKKNS